LFLSFLGSSQRYLRVTGIDCYSDVAELATEGSLLHSRSQQGEPRKKTVFERSFFYPIRRIGM